MLGEPRPKSQAEARAREIAALFRYLKAHHIMVQPVNREACRRHAVAEFGRSSVRNIRLGICIPPPWWAPECCAIIGTTWEQVRAWDAAAQALALEAQRKAS